MAGAPNVAETIRHLRAYWLVQFKFNARAFQGQTNPFTTADATLAGRLRLIASDTWNADGGEIGFDQNINAFPTFDQVGTAGFPPLANNWAIWVYRDDGNIIQRIGVADTRLIVAFPPTDTADLGNMLVTARTNLEQTTASKIADVLAGAPGATPADVAAAAALRLDTAMGGAVAISDQVMLQFNPGAGQVPIFDLMNTVVGNGGFIVFTGYSRGGAVAELVAQAFVVYDPATNRPATRLIQFASPRVGNAAHAAAVQAAIPENQNIHIFDPRDPVTVLPTTARTYVASTRRAGVTPDGLLSGVYQASDEEIVRQAMVCGVVRPSQHDSRVISAMLVRLNRFQ